MKASPYLWLFLLLCCWGCGNAYVMETEYGINNLLYQEVKASYYGDYDKSTWRQMRPSIRKLAIKQCFPQSKVIYKGRTTLDPLISTVWLEQRDTSTKGPQAWKTLALVELEPLQNFTGSKQYSYLWVRSTDTLWVQEWAIPTEANNYRLLFFSTKKWKGNLKREATKLASQFRYQRSAQDLLVEAEGAYKQKEYESAAKLYREALKRNGESVDVKDYYDAACAWALIDSSEQALVYLDSAVRKGWINARWMGQDPDLHSLHGQADYEALRDKAWENYEQYIQRCTNVPLLKKLETLYVRDQSLRQLSVDARARFGANKEQLDYFFSLMQMEDSLVLEELLPILEENGWPGISEVGNRGNAAVYLIIQHAPLDVQKRYLPALRASVKEGESLARHLAYLEDRVRVQTGEKQLYGSQLTLNPDTGKNEFYPIEHPKEVNARRAAIGLGPLEDYAKRYGIEWPVTNTSSEE